MIKILFPLISISLLYSSNCFSENLNIKDFQNTSIPFCSSSTPVGDLCKAKIIHLRPTQIAIGMLEVNEKAKKIHNMTDSELNDYEKLNPEPVVVGPEGNLYITDHHHLARALYMEGIENTYCQIIENNSALNENLFWQLLEEKKWVYPFDEKGNGPKPYSAIPLRIDQLKDDPYRSLAYSVRKASGFNKTSIPFAEFQWANYFRSRIAEKDLLNNFEKAVQIGVKLAHSPEASGLPGYQKL